MSDLTNKIVGNGALTVAARVSILLFSLVGVPLLPVVYHSIGTLNDTLATLDKRIAVNDEHVKQQDTRMDALESTTRAENAVLADHGTRLIRLEDRAGMGTLRLEDRAGLGAH